MGRVPVLCLATSNVMPFFPPFSPQGNLYNGPGFLVPVLRGSVSHTQQLYENLNSSFLFFLIKYVKLIVDDTVNLLKAGCPL